MEQQINKLIASIVLVADGWAIFYWEYNDSIRSTAKAEQKEAEYRAKRQVNLKTGALRRRFARVRWLLSFARPVIA